MASVVENRVVGIVGNCLVLPLAPLRVGLVTSEGSAAEADFFDELRRSGFAFEVLLADARVQGFTVLQVEAHAKSVLLHREQRRDLADARLDRLQRDELGVRAAIRGNQQAINQDGRTAVTVNRSVCDRVILPKNLSGSRLGAVEVPRRPQGVDPAVVNGHGGNDFNPMLRELYGRAGVHLFLCNWYQVVGGEDYTRLFATKDDPAARAAWNHSCRSDE